MPWLRAALPCHPSPFASGLAACLAGIFITGPNANFVEATIDPTGPIVITPIIILDFGAIGILCAEFAINPVILSIADLVRIIFVGGRNSDGLFASVLGGG